MKEIINRTCKEIISEPGDATRYHYIVAQDYDDFYFMPYGSFIKYPQNLNYFDIKDLTDEKYINEMAEEKNCNPWTLKECIRTVIEFKKED